MNIELILFYGLIISFVSMTGVAIVKSNKKVAAFVNKHLNILTAVSAGVFLVTSFILARETIEILSLTNALVAFAIGIIIYLLLHKVLSPHRHEGSEHTHDHDHKRSGWKILIGDAIHNIADGIFLVAAFGVSPTVGSSTALSIILHEAPQEISEFLVLRKSGYTTAEDSFRNFGTDLSIFVGIAIGLIVTQSSVLQAYLLGITATFFLGIVFTDLFPIRTIMKHKENIGQLFAALSLGILIMLGINMSLGHDHGHDYDEHEHELNHVDDHDDHDEHGEHLNFR